MYRTTGIYDHPTRPAGEPDAWGDSPPTWRRPEPQHAYGAPSRAYSPAERRRTETTVQEFHTLARAIEEQRGRVRQRDPAPAMRVETRRPSAAAAASPRPSATPDRYRPAQTPQRAQSNVTWLRQRSEPPRRTVEPAPAPPPTSHFAAAHEAREARRTSWAAHDIARYVEEPVPAASSRGRRVTAAAAPQPARPAPPRAAQRAYDHAPPAPESELRRLAALVAELEERVRVLEEGRPARTRTRRVVSEPGPSAAHTVPSANAPRRLWG